MNSEPIQLHSASGRLLYLLLSSFFWIAIAASVLAWRLPGAEQIVVPLRLVLPIECVPLFFVWRWARRSGGAIYATSEGLELARARLLIPWSHIVGVDRVPLMSRLQPYYRISFADNRRPLAFYACEDVERVVRSFKAAHLARNSGVGLADEFIA